MKTGNGTEINPEHFSGVFCYNGVTCNVGCFDPSSYPEMMTSFKFDINMTPEQSQAVFDQIDDSGLFLLGTIHKLGAMSQEEFVSYFSELPILESHIGMEHKDFTISLHFWTFTGEWVCTDVGTRTIVARKISDINGDEILFDEYDFGGCSLSQFV